MRQRLELCGCSDIHCYRGLHHAIQPEVFNDSLCAMIAETGRATQQQLEFVLKDRFIYEINNKGYYWPNFKLNDVTR